MNEEKDFVEIEIPIDEELYKQVAAVCAEYGTTPEEVAVRFLYWCVENPEEAKTWLQFAMEEQAALEK